MNAVICSHGFGVDATGRGLFTDIAAALPELQFTMFAYNSFDAQGNMTVQPLPRQAEQLNAQLAAANGAVTLLCHSQGCVVAALADLSKVTQLLFLAPPDNFDIERFGRMFDGRPGLVFDPAGLSVIPRRDGTTTYIGREYIASLEATDVPALFARVAAERPTTIIRAAADEVVGDTAFPDVPAQVLTIPGDHNFTGPNRAGLIETLRPLLH